MDLIKYFNDDYNQYNTSKKHTSIEHTCTNPDIPPNYIAVWDDFSVSKSYVNIFPHLIDQVVSNHFHNFFEFVYVYKGSLKIHIDDTEVTLEENDICLLNLQAKHRIEAVDLSRNIIYYIMINTDYFKSTYFHLIYIPANDYIFDFFWNQLPIIKLKIIIFIFPTIRILLSYP